MMRNGETDGRRANKSTMPGEGDDTATNPKATPFALDLDGSSPQEISDYILSLLPNNDDDDFDRYVPKFIRAMDLVKEDLANRRWKASGPTSSSGRGASILNGRIQLPEDIMLHILEFVPHRTIVHGVSLVNKTWSSVTRKPRLWTELSTETGFRCWKKGRNMTMDDFLSIVRRPQFASLKSVVLPDRVDLGDDRRMLRYLADACPMLEELDIGNENTTVRAKDRHILSLPKFFPRLSKVGLNMCSVSDKGICGFLKRMGPRLLEIKIRSIAIRSSTLSDDALRAAAQHCPNLTGFGYMISSCVGIMDAPRGQNRAVKEITSIGINALLQGCPQLTSLVLVGTRKVHFRAFRAVVDGDGSLGSNLQYLELRSYSKEYSSISFMPVDEYRIRVKLERKIPNCQWNRPFAPYLKLHPWHCKCHRRNGCLCF